MRDILERISETHTYTVTIKSTFPPQTGLFPCLFDMSVRAPSESEASQRALDRVHLISAPLLPGEQVAVFRVRAQEQPA